MSKFTLEIDMDNDAMQTPDDVSHALIMLAAKVIRAKHGDSGIVQDENGNTVGHWAFLGRSDDERDHDETLPGSDALEDISYKFDDDDNLGLTPKH